MWLSIEQSQEPTPIVETRRAQELWAALQPRPTAARPREDDAEAFEVLPPLPRARFAPDLVLGPTASTTPTLTRPKSALKLSSAMSKSHSIHSLAARSTPAGPERKLVPSPTVAGFLAPPPPQLGRRRTRTVSAAPTTSIPAPAVQKSLSVGAHAPMLPFPTSPDFGTGPSLTESIMSSLSRPTDFEGGPRPRSVTMPSSHAGRPESADFTWAISTDEVVLPVPRASPSRIVSTHELARRHAISKAHRRSPASPWTVPKPLPRPDSLDISGFAMALLAMADTPPAAPVPTTAPATGRRGRSGTIVPAARNAPTSSPLAMSLSSPPALPVPPGPPTSPAPPLVPKPIATAPESPAAPSPPPRPPRSVRRIVPVSPLSNPPLARNTPEPLHALPQPGAGPSRVDTPTSPSPASASAEASSSPSIASIAALFKRSESICSLGTLGGAGEAAGGDPVVAAEAAESASSCLPAALGVSLAIAGAQHDGADSGDSDDAFESADEGDENVWEPGSPTCRDVVSPRHRRILHRRMTQLGDRQARSIRPGRPDSDPAPAPPLDEVQPAALSPSASIQSFRSCESPFKTLVRDRSPGLQLSSSLVSMVSMGETVQSADATFISAEDDECALVGAFPPDSPRSPALSDGSSLATRVGLSLTPTNSAPTTPAIAYTWRSHIGETAYQSARETFGETEMRRQEVIWELCETEASFVDGLQAVIELFVFPIRTRAGKWLPGVPVDVAKLFDWFEDIRLAHKDLSAAMQRRASSEEVCIRVADVLLPWVSSLEVHQRYLARFESVSRTIIAMAADSESDFGNYIAMQSALPECGKLSLSSYLLKPVQRLMKYPLFFKQLCDLTPPGHPDYVSTVRLHRETDEIIRIMQEVKAREDEYASLKTLEHSMRGLPVGFQLAKRDRRILARGVLRRVQVSSRERTDIELAAATATHRTHSRRTSLSPLFDPPPVPSPPFLCRPVSFTSESDSGQSSLSLTPSESSACTTPPTPLSDLFHEPPASPTFSTSLPRPSFETFPSISPTTSPSLLTLSETDSFCSADLSIDGVPTRLRQRSLSAGRLLKKATEASVHVFVFSDLVIMASRHDDGPLLKRGEAVKRKKRSRTYRVAESLGVTRVLGVSDVSGNIGYEHLLRVNLIPLVTSDDAATFPSPTPLFFTLPDRPSMHRPPSTREGLLAEWSRWRAAFDSAFQSSLGELARPVRVECNSRVNPHTRQPSDEALRERPMKEQEREERAWWEQRHLEVRKDMEAKARSDVVAPAGWSAKVYNAPPSRHRKTPSASSFFKRRASAIAEARRPTMTDDDRRPSFPF